MLLFNAIYPSIYNIPTDVCIFVAKWIAWPTLLSLATVQLLLIVRVYAIYEQSKGIAAFLGILFIATIVSFVVIAILVLKGTIAGTGGDILPGCIFIAPPFLWTSWIPPVIFESVVVFLTIYKVIECRQKCRQNLQNPRTPRILYMVARDSLLYFIVMFAALFGNLLLSRFQKGYLSAVLVLPSSVIACIAASRMTIHFWQRERSREHSGSPGFTMQAFGFTTVEDDASDS
jgi:hypothetical protein